MRGLTHFGRWAAGRGVGTDFLRKEEALRWVPAEWTLAKGFWKSRASLKEGSGPGLETEMGLGKGGLGQLGPQVFPGSPEVKQLHPL